MRLRGAAEGLLPVSGNKDSLGDGTHAGRPRGSGMKAFAGAAILASCALAEACSPMAYSSFDTVCGRDAQVCRAMPHSGLGARDWDNATAELRRRAVGIWERVWNGSRPESPESLEIMNAIVEIFQQANAIEPDIRPRLVRMLEGALSAGELDRAPYVRAMAFDGMPRRSIGTWETVISQDERRDVGSSRERRSVIVSTAQMIVRENIPAESELRTRLLIPFLERVLGNGDIDPPAADAFNPRSSQRVDAMLGIADAIANQPADSPLKQRLVLEVQQALRGTQVRLFAYDFSQNPGECATIRDIARQMDIPPRGDSDAPAQREEWIRLTDFRNMGCERPAGTGESSSYIIPSGPYAPTLPPSMPPLSNPTFGGYH